MFEPEALQWLSTRSIPSRWSPYSRFTPETDRTWKRLRLLNENEISSYSSQAFEGFPMEVLYEMVRQSNQANKSS